MKCRRILFLTVVLMLFGVRSLDTETIERPAAEQKTVPQSDIV